MRNSPNGQAYIQIFIITVHAKSHDSTAHTWNAQRFVLAWPVCLHKNTIWGVVYLLHKCVLHLIALNDYPMRDYAFKVTNRVEFYWFIGYILGAMRFRYYITIISTNQRVTQLKIKYRNIMSGFKCVYNVDWFITELYGSFICDILVSSSCLIGSHPTHEDRVRRTEFI